MPELPEVEVTRRVLEPLLKERRLLSCRPIAPSFYRLPPSPALRAVEGLRVLSVGRAGKYLVLALDGGKKLVLHLGMSGRVALNGDGGHKRLELRFEGAPPVIVFDPRRFGRVLFDLPSLGPDPLAADFRPETLARAFAGRRAPVKALLMDQKLVAGLGNIYATEALFKAGVRPQKAAGRLSRAELSRLAGAVGEVLSEGIRLGGSTLRDKAFLDPLGRPGRAQEALSVYGRGGEGRCGHALKITSRVIAGRRAIYCPICQK